VYYHDSAFTTALNFYSTALGRGAFNRINWIFSAFSCHNMTKG